MTRYSLLSAVWADEAIVRAFEQGDFSAASLAAHEETWRERPGA